jgi:3-oxoacyl-[acyl-carrier protein] reductase
MDLGLEGKVALVTGANRGVGKELALAFAREGADIGICARDADKLRALEDEITALGVRCAAIPADLARPEECQRVVDSVVLSLGRLDVLVNNASTNVDGLGRVEIDSASELMQRLLGKTTWAIQCTQAAFPYLRDAEGGRVVFIGGTAGRAVSSPDGASGLVSGMGNAALVAFAKYVSRQWAPHKILVNVVHPGNTKTDRYYARVERKAKADGTSIEEAAATLDKAAPLGRLVEPADIAPVVLFLASHLASAITGQTIAVDGGVSPTIVY